MKKLLLVAFVAAVGCLGCSDESPTRARQDTAGDRDQILAAALESRESGLQVEGQGEVVRLLSDDVDGNRHQRFIIRLDSGQTLLVAHNIDVAPRVAGLRVGDDIQFNGEYEWNAEGGVLHWTHRDPAGRHASGWLKHDGHVYR